MTVDKPDIGALAKRAKELAEATRGGDSQDRSEYREFAIANCRLLADEVMRLTRERDEAISVALRDAAQNEARLAEVERERDASDDALVWLSNAKEGQYRVHQISDAIIAATARHRSRQEKTTTKDKEE